MTTTHDRTLALGHMRKRLSFLVKNRPYYVGTIKDTRVCIEALEALVTLDFKEIKNANEKRI